MKKFSLIVALMLALTVIFISCGADPLPPPPPDDSETFTDIDLVDEDGKLAYNYFAGQPENQKGWATDGQSEIDKDVGKLGFKTEDFQAAKFLTLEIDKDNFKGDFGIGYGVEPSAAGSALGLSNAGWMTKTIVSQGNVTAAAANGVTLTGSELKIELAKALPRYDAFIDSSVKEVKLFLLYYEGVDKLVKGAKLQISSLPPEFYAATAITVTPIKALANADIKLAATITPTGTTVQLITWQIVPGGTLKAPQEVDFALNQPLGPEITKSKDTIRVTNPLGGTVIVRATLKNGGLDKDKNKVDVTADYTITVGPNPFEEYSNAKSYGVKTGDRPKWVFATKEDEDGYSGPLADLKEAKYAVVATIYEEGRDGIGTVQWTFQGNGNAPNDWKGDDNKGAGNINPYEIIAGDFVYFVFDLSEFAHLTTLKGLSEVTQIQFYINWSDSGAGVKVGDTHMLYLTSEDMNFTKAGLTATNWVAAGGSFDFVKSYVTKTLPVLF